MSNLNLYKEFYFREIDRKNDLNNAINIPILVITVIISIHFYLFNEVLNPNVLDFGKVLGSINFITIIVSMLFLIKSYSNFYIMHTYRELSDMGNYHQYEESLNSELGDAKLAQMEFESHLVAEFSECAKHNFNVNKKRTEDLAKSKKFLFFAVFLTIILSIIYIISIF
mgnify:CR=1 FL=1